MNKNTLLWLGFGGLAAWYFLFRKPDRSGQILYLTDWINGTQSTSEEKSTFAAKLATQMSDAEVDTVYEYIHDYYTKGKNLVEGSDLFNRLMAVSNKYQIFT